MNRKTVIVCQSVADPMQVIIYGSVAILSKENGLDQNESRRVRSQMNQKGYSIRTIQGVPYVVRRVPFNENPKSKEVLVRKKNEEPECMVKVTADEAKYIMEEKKNPVFFIDTKELSVTPCINLKVISIVTNYKSYGLSSFLAVNKEDYACT